MERKAVFYCLAIALIISSPILKADPATPAGVWRQIDDETGKPRSQIRIHEHGDQYDGSIEKIFLEADESPDLRCEKCTDWRKNKPLIGLTILSGMRGTSLNYKGGEILDPDEGRVYQCEMDLDADSRHLRVRGYLGTSFFGRTQIWERVE